MSPPTCTRAPEPPTLIDEWAQSGIGSADDIRDLFSDRFFFCCEGDDPPNVVAFDPMGTPFETQLHAFCGSDIGHWDVPEMREVLEETCELVEKGLMKEDQLREVVFANPVELWTSGNPNFFKDTVVESEVNKLLSDQAKAKAGAKTA